MLTKYKLITKLDAVVKGLRVWRYRHRNILSQISTTHAYGYRQKDTDDYFIVSCPAAIIAMACYQKMPCPAAKAFPGLKLIFDPLEEEHDWTNKFPKRYTKNTNGYKYREGYRQGEYFFTVPDRVKIPDWIRCFENTKIYPEEIGKILWKSYFTKNEHKLIRKYWANYTNWDNVYWKDRELPNGKLYAPEGDELAMFFSIGQDIAYAHWHEQNLIPNSISVAMVINKLVGIMDRVKKGKSNKPPELKRK